MKKLAIASITALSLAALGSAASAQVATGTVTGPSGNPNFPFQVTTPNGAVFFCSADALNHFLELIEIQREERIHSLIISR